MAKRYIVSITPKSKSEVHREFGLDGENFMVAVGKPVEVSEKQAQAIRAYSPTLAEDGISITEL